MLGMIAAAAISNSLHVEGDHLVEDGKTVWLHGVEVPGLESANEDLHAFRSVRVAIEDWHANTILLPLCEDRWLGKAPGQKDKGGEYRDAVDEIVSYVTRTGNYLIIQLAWTDAGKPGVDLGAHAMPDENSKNFWKQVARKYRNSPHVIFSVFGEPDAEVVGPDGFAQAGPLNYKAVSFEELAREIRRAGAKNILSVPGADPIAWIGQTGKGDLEGDGIVLQNQAPPSGTQVPSFYLEPDGPPNHGTWAGEPYWVMGVMSLEGTGSQIKNWQYQPRSPAVLRHLEEWSKRQPTSSP